MVPMQNLNLATNFQESAGPEFDRFIQAIMANQV